MRSVDGFKVGFLRRTAEMGLIPSDLEGRMSKPAILKELLGVGHNFGYMALMLALGLPVVGGFAAGGIGRAMLRADDEDVDEVKTREMTKLYHNLANDARDRSKYGS